MLLTSSPTANLRGLVWPAFLLAGYMRPLHVESLCLTISTSLTGWHSLSKSLFVVYYLSGCGGVGCRCQMENAKGSRGLWVCAVSPQWQIPRGYNVFTGQILLCACLPHANEGKGLAFMEFCHDGGSQKEKRWQINDENDLAFCTVKEAGHSTRTGLQWEYLHLCWPVPMGS